MQQKYFAGPAGEQLFSEQIDAYLAYKVFLQYNTISLFFDATKYII